MSGERMTFTFSNVYGEARASKNTRDMFKNWEKLCEENPSYAVYCLDFLEDVIGELQQKYEYFCQR